MMGGDVLIWVCRRIVLLVAAVVLLIQIDGLVMLGMGPGGGHPAGGESGGPDGSDSSTMVPTGRFAAALPAYAQQAWQEGSGDTDADAEAGVSSSQKSLPRASRLAELKGSFSARTNSTKGSCSPFKKHKREMAAAAAAVAALLLAVFLYRKWKDPKAGEGDQASNAQQLPQGQERGGVSS